MAEWKQNGGLKTKWRTENKMEESKQNGCLKTKWRIKKQNGRYIGHKISIIVTLCAQCPTENHTTKPPKLN